jgi:hypothetical protein
MGAPYFRNVLEAVAGGQIPFALSATGAEIRAAILDPASYASGGWLLPGTAGARLSASARASVAMQQRVDGGWEFAPHNLLTRSAEFDNAAWGKTGTVSITANFDTAPDGTATADRFVSTGGAFPQAAQSSTLVAGAAYTFSVWVRSDGTAQIQQTLILEGGLGLVNFTPTATWTRVSVSIAASAGGSQSVVIATNSGSAAASSFLLWGAQLNLGPAPTAYIPTTTTAVYGPAIDWLSGIGAYGLRSEEARTNLALWSSDLTNAVWNPNNPGVGVLPVKTLVAGAGLDGGAATRFQLDCGNVGSGVNRSAVTQSITIANATAYATTVWLKAFDAGNVGKTVRVTSDFVGNVVVTLTAAWQRVSLTGTSSGTASNVIVETRGTYTTQTADVLVWCPQLEQGAFATSPILTFGASATRAADAVQVTGLPVAASGTFVLDFVRTAPLGAAASARLLYSVTTGAPTIFVENNTLIGRAGLENVFAIGGTAAAVAALSRVAFAYAQGDHALSTNGAAVSTSADATAVAAQSTYFLGANNAGGANLNGYIIRPRFATRRFTNAQLQALTA